MPVLENIEIREILPHRYPMLLVDRVLEMGDDYIVGIKNVTANEPFFQGHFPDFPVMPGVLIVEAMAQVGGILALSGVEDRKDKLVFFASIEEAKFRKPVLPGDTLQMKLTTLKKKPSLMKMRGEASVGGQLVAEAVVMCRIVDKAPAGAEPQA
jgi:3-hydroxyacyl-[acyl-carrier-protein] dehydratase